MRIYLVQFVLLCWERHKSVPQQLRQLIRAQAQRGQMEAKHWVKVGCLQSLHEVSEEDLQRQLHAALGKYW
jgi:hypothetical protein